MLMAYAIGGARAQQLTTKGTLQDATSGEALPFTNCVLLRQQDSTFVQGTTTDASGLFRFSHVDTGSYLLRISAIGYEPYWQQISLPPDTALGTISLFHSATNLPLQRRWRKDLLPRGGRPQRADRHRQRCPPERPGRGSGCRGQHHLPRQDRRGSLD